MPNCVVKGCRNYHTKFKKCHGIAYHRFPNDPVRNDIWCRIIRKQRKEPYFKPHKNARICSAHFLEKDCDISKAGLRKLKGYAIPRLEIEDNENAEQLPSINKIQCSKMDEMDVDISDIKSIFDSPRKVILKKRIAKLKKRQTVVSKKIKKLQNENAKLKKENKSLLNIIKDLKLKNYITDQMESILEKNAEIAELYRLQVIKNRSSRKKKMVTNTKKTYSPALRKFAMTLNFYSPSAYKYVRRKFDSCLPHPRILTKWYSCIDGEPGFTEESFEMLKLKRESMSDNIECCLIFDEMNIRQAKLWKGEKNVGHVDMGHGHIDKEKKATKAFVMMLACLSENWKIPVGYFLVDGLTSELIANTVNICLEKCHSVGVNIEALTFDGCPINVKAANILGCNISNTGQLKTTFPHPVTQSEIVVFLDACHMVKFVRNVFESKKIIFNEKDERIEWKFLVRLLKLQTNQKLNFANKLTYRHIYFRNQIMKVKLATQLLSRSVANAMALCNEELNSRYFSNSSATVEFINIFNNIFDVLNSRKFNQTHFKRAICPKNKTKIFKCIDESFKYIKGLKVFNKVKREIKKHNRQPRIILIISKKSILDSKSKTGFLGLTVCLESLKILYQNVVEKNSKLKYISTYRLSQDHLELFFSMIRKHGGYNDNPNATQLKGAYRRCMNHLSLKSTFTGNSVPLDNFPILTVSSVNAINCTSEMYRHEEDEEEEIMHHPRTLSDEIEEESDRLYSNNCAQLSRSLDDTSGNIFGHLCKNIELIVGYIAGWVARSLTKQLKCEKCIESLASNEKLYFHKLIELKYMGGLTFPSRDLYEVCLETERSIRNNKRPQFMSKLDYMRLSTGTLSKFVGKDTFNVLSLHSTEQPATFNHRVHLIRAIIKKYINVRMHHESIIENTGKRTKRQQFKKLVLFKGQ